MMVSPHTKEAIFSHTDILTHNVLINPEVKRGVNFTENSIEPCKSA